MLLEVENLSVVFPTRRGDVKAVDRLSFSIQPGESLGIVGESGSGKSVTSLALMGLLPKSAQITAAQLKFEGRDLKKLSERELQKIRGGSMAMIFQDPMSSLNPCFTVGFQLAEALRAHKPELSKNDILSQSIALLQQVGIPEARERLNAYPHQLSGGMSQRVMIAMAMSSSPKILIADEPTTALDVTIQKQIMDLIRKIQREHKMSLILISHDIGLIAETTERVIVMYAGQKVEMGPTNQVIAEPHHPYTEALLEALPSRHVHGQFRMRLPTIAGLVPDLTQRPSGCQLHPRCRYAQSRCSATEPEEYKTNGSIAKCFFPLHARPV